MGEHRLCQSLDVIRGDEVASLEGRPGLCRTKQAQRSAGARPQPDVGVRPGAMGDARDVLLQLIVDVDLLDRLLAGEQLIG